MSEASNKLGKGGARLYSLQAGRAIAAIFVVLSHNSAEVFDNKKYWPTSPLPNIFDFGHAGVEYFFVLSGFIILHVHWRDVGDVKSVGPYLWKRFARIFPTYWIVLSTLVAVYFIVPRFGDGFEREQGSILSSFFLIAWRMHDYGMPLTILVVAWSLYHELLYYLLFAGFIADRRLGIGLLLLWFAGSAAMIFTPASPTLLSFYFAPVHLLFGLGMGAAWLFRNTVVPRPGLLAAGGIVFYLASATCEAWGPVPVQPQVQSLPYGVGATMAVLGFAALERSGRLRVTALFSFLGDASYAIYLLHQPVLIFLAKAVDLLPMRTKIPVIFWYVVFPCTAVFAAVIFHLIVERPLLLRLQKLTRRPGFGALGSLPADIIPPR